MLIPDENHTHRLGCTGTSITVIGIVHASNDTVPPAVASYTIDDEGPLTLPLPISTRDIPNQQFFESPNLPLAAHTLVVNITSDGSPYTLDTLLICTKSTNPISAVLAPTPKNTAHKDLPEIIVGVAGGVVALILIVVGVVLLHRRRRKRQASRTVSSPIWSWLQRRTSSPFFATHYLLLIQRTAETTLFTSSESIMRNNPSKHSTLDPYDKLSNAEKAPPGSARDSVRDVSDQAADSTILPVLPAAVLKLAPGDAGSDKRSTVLRRTSDSSSRLLPVLSLDSESLSDKLSDKLPFSAHPDAYMSLPPHPPLPASTQAAVRRSSG